MEIQPPEQCSSKAAAEGRNKESQSENISFRVRGVPTDWSHEHLQSFLNSQDAGLNVSIRSLASEAGEQYQSATAVFSNIPSPLRNHPHWDIVVPETFNAGAIGAKYLNIDKDFYGLTTFFAPPPHDHEIE
jgi:hypothetical protein